MWRNRLELFAILFLITSLITVPFSYNPVFGAEQIRYCSIILQIYPSTVSDGEKAKLTGYLIASGPIIPETIWVDWTTDTGLNARHWVYEDGDFSRGHILYPVGVHTITATFEGPLGTLVSNSVTLTVTPDPVTNSEPKPQFIRPPCSSSSETTPSSATSKKPTEIVITSYPSSAKTGETITIEGKLTTSGKGIAGERVYVRDSDVDIPKAPLTSVITDANGRFSAKWIVEDVDSHDRSYLSFWVYGEPISGTIVSLSNSIIALIDSGTVEFYATFNGNEKYQKSTSCPINKYGKTKFYCTNNVMVIHDTSSSVQQKIFYQVLGAFVPGSDFALDASKEIFPQLSSTTLSNSDKQRLENQLRNIFEKDLEVDASNLSLNEMLELAQDEQKLRQFVNSYYSTKTQSPQSTPYIPPTKSPERYTTFERGPSQLDTINEQLQFHDEKQKILKNKIEQMKSKLSQIEKTHNAKLGLTLSKLNDIAEYESYEEMYELTQLLIERGYASQAYKDIAKENQRLDNLIRGVDRLEEDLIKKYADVDVIKPTKVKESQKMEIQTLRDQFLHVINDLEKGVEVSEKSLTGLTFQKKEAQEKINTAWNHLKDTKKRIDAFDNYYLKNIDEASKSNYLEGVDRNVDAGMESARKAGENLVKISELIEEAKELEKQKFCFLWWCW